MFSFPSSIFILYIFILISMAFFTLFERKILSYSQLRKGPNKVSLMGIPQPLADALKLISKENSNFYFVNKFMFYSGPIMSLMLTLLLWSIYSPFWWNFSLKFSILFFLCISSLNVYSFLLSGWASNSKFSLLGSLRSVAQTISYEVTLSLIIISILLLIWSFNFNKFFLYMNFNMSILSPILFMLWFLIILAELNRTPFDLSEGESELVSGFNTEFSSGLFTLIFMSEYLNIIFMAFITSSLFLSYLQNLSFNFIFFILKLSILAFILIWARSTLPRMRYDFLMNFSWKLMLPFSLMIILFHMFIF